MYSSGPVVRALRTSVAAALLTCWVAPAWASAGWRRSDTRRCRVHWSAPTPRVARRVVAACDAVADAVAPGAAPFDVVVEDRPGRTSGAGGVARVAAAGGTDRRHDVGPGVEIALARALGAAAAARGSGAARLEVSALAREARPRWSAGAVIGVGGGGGPGWRVAGEGLWRAERAGGGAWTTGRDMVLRVAVLGDALLEPGQWGPREASGGGPSGLAEIQGYSFARFLSERFDDDPLGRGEADVVRLHGDWLARAEAVYADQAEAIGDEVSGRRMQGGHAPSGPDVDHLRVSEDGRLLTWTAGGLGVVAAWGEDAQGPSKILARVPAPGGLSLSPDGRRVVAADGELFVHDVVSGAVRRLSEGLTVAGPAWSPAGDRVAFVHRRDGRSRLGWVDPARPEAGITWVLAPEDGAWIEGPRWFADGRSSHSHLSRRLPARPRRRGRRPWCRCRPHLCPAAG